MFYLATLDRTQVAKTQLYIGFNHDINKIKSSKNALLRITERPTCHSGIQVGLHLVYP